MLSFELMGLAALAVMWTATLLIVASLVSDGARLSRHLSSARPLTLALAGLAVILVAAIGITALALTRPYFGPMSTAGGALGLAFFLVVQPAGVMLRERMQSGSR